VCARQPSVIDLHRVPCRRRLRRRSTAEEVQAVAQAGLDFIRNNVSINSIITGGPGGVHCLGWMAGK